MIRRRNFRDLSVYISKGKKNLNINNRIIQIKNLEK
jgi:hypothetical protein